MNIIEQQITEFLEETAPLVDNADNLPVETAIELYNMYEVMAKTATINIKQIDTALRVQLCIELDEILERVVDDMPALNVNPSYKNIYTPAIKNYPRWKNVELLKDCGLVVYMLGNLTDLHPVMLYGRQDEDFPYLDVMTGLEVIKTDEDPDNIGIYFEHLSRNFKQIDVLALYGLYPFIPSYLEMYRNLRPDGTAYLALDMNRHWMGRIPWGDDVVVKAAERCNIIATSSRPMRNALNANPDVSFPCRWFTNGFYNPTGIPVVADADKKENIILTVGQIGIEQKNNMELMVAFALASDSLPGWTLRLVGGIAPEFLPQIDAFFEKRPDMKERVIFTGAITDKKDLYKEYERAKIFALTSTFECFPNVYSEALFHGCMFITSDIDPADDMIKTSEFGMQYKLGDMRSLTSHIIEMAKKADKAAFEKYIPQALDYANRYFDWDRNAKKIAYMMFCDKRF